MTLKHPSSLMSQDSAQAVLIPAALRTRRTMGHSVPISAGLCVPKGQLNDAVSGYVEGFSQRVPTDLDVLNRWSDGSVRWMLASFVAPEISSDVRSVGIVAMPGPSSAANSLSGLSGASFERHNFTTVKLVQGEICLNSRDLNSDPPVEQTLRINPQLSDADGEDLTLQFDDIREEVSGTERQVFVVCGRVQSRPFITLQFRFIHWPAAGLVQVETRIRNTRRARHNGGLWDLGDPGSFLFRSLEISVRNDDLPATAVTHWKVDRNHPTMSTTSEVFVRQFGSGGQNRNCSNHVTASGVNSGLGHGYEVTCGTTNLEGDRAEPVLMLESDSSWLAMAVSEFWQQFPTSAAAAMGLLEVGLFPELNSNSHELQGGEQKTVSFWLASGRDDHESVSLDWAFDPPRLIQSAASVSQADAIPWFCSSETPDSAQSNRSENTETQKVQPQNRQAQYLDKATSGPFSLEARRASIDEYGWRNFGDIPADHEQTHYAGSNTIVSHYNNQFDMVYGGLLQFLATGDLKWFDLFDPLARHVMDIDIYHTDEDRSAFNGGLFWHTDHYVDARTCTHRTYSRHNQQEGVNYGGGPSCEHNYTTGLLHYYFLTGNPEARFSVLSLADWVIRMDDGASTILGLLDDGPTGAASATVFEDFHGPGRGAGNSINALLDAWMLTGSPCYMNKLNELIRRCVHPSQNPADLHLLDAEGHWSYSVFLNSLGRYLVAKHEAGLLDEMYSYAHQVMLTYGRWMAINERRTLDRPEELKYPTEAWAAQDFRKANVLRIAASCESDTTLAAAMRAKADLISDAAWGDFADFGVRAMNARCLSIVMTEGQREVFHRTRPSNSIPVGSRASEHGEWIMFVPQKTRVKAILKSPVRLMKASLRALHPLRIMNAWRAFRRQM